MQEVIFKELSTEEQKFVDTVLATCFHNSESSAKWITKVETKQTEREQWYVIYKNLSSTGNIEIDLVLNGVATKAALTRWLKRKLLIDGLDTTLGPQEADIFLKSCIYGT